MIQLGIYRHFKGNHYRVVSVARHSETLEEFVVYQALYGDMGMWIRPAVMFAAEVLVNGQKIKRFEYIGENSALTE